MHITVDRDLCDLHAQCVFEAPAVFSLTDDDELVHDPRPADEHRPDVDRAAAACPVGAIVVGDD